MADQKTTEDKANLNKILLCWKSPSHAYKKHEKLYFQTIGAIAFLLSVIFFFLHDYILIIVTLSVAFMVYVIYAVEPIEVEHRITPYGFENAGRIYRWLELYAFWFEEKYGQKILVMQTRLSFPNQLRALLSGQSEEKIKEIIDQYLLYIEKPPKTFADKFSDWLGKVIPLESRN